MLREKIESIIKDFDSGKLKSSLQNNRVLTIEEVPEITNMYLSEKDNQLYCSYCNNKLISKSNYEYIDGRVVEFLIPFCDCKDFYNFSDI